MSVISGGGALFARYIYGEVAGVSDTRSGVKEDVAKKL